MSRNELRCGHSCGSVSNRQVIRPIRRIRRQFCGRSGDEDRSRRGTYDKSHGSSSRADGRRDLVSACNRARSSRPQRRMGDAAARGPARAQPGPHIGEFQGLPINDANRARGEAWSASLWTVPEHQCIPHPADYGLNFSNLKIWHDTDPVTGDIGWSDSASAGAGREASRAAT